MLFRSLAWKRLYPQGGAPPSQAFVELVAEDVEGAVPAPATGAERPIPVAELAFTGGLTLRNPKDPESFKVRRAKVGGYRDYFSAEQADELEELVRKNLSPALGYNDSLSTQTNSAAV